MLSFKCRIIAVAMEETKLQIDKFASAMLKAAEFDTWLCMLCTIRASRGEQRSLQAYGFCFVDVPSSWEERGPLAANLSSPFLVLALPLVSCAVSALGALARNSSRPRPFQRRLLSRDFAGRA